MSIQIGNTANLNSYISNQQSSRERILLQSAVQSNLIHLYTNDIFKTYIVFENNYSDSNLYYIGKSNAAFIIANNTSNLITMTDTSISFRPRLDIPSTMIQQLSANNAVIATATITSNFQLINDATNDKVFSIINPNSNAPLLSAYSTGKIGIGTSQPFEALHVAQTIRSDVAVKTPKLNVNNVYVANDSIANMTTNVGGDLILKTATGRMILDANVVEANIGYTSNLNFTNLVLTTGRLFSSTFEIAPGLSPYDYVPYSLKINHKGMASAIGVPSSNMVQMAIQYQTSNGGPYGTHYPFQIDSVGRIGLGTLTPKASIDYYYNSNIDINSNGVLRIYGTQGPNESLIIDPMFRIGINTSQTVHNIGLHYTAQPLYGQSPSNITYSYTSNLFGYNTIGNFAIQSYSQSNINYGTFFAISSNASTIVVGAPNSNQGTVYIYQWNGTAWNYSSNLTSTNTIGDQFGKSLALSSNASVIVVGAPGSNFNQGAAFVYTYVNNSWEQQAKFTPHSSNQSFGSNVAISLDGNTIAVSAHGSNQSQGGAYIYRWVAPNWTQDTFLTTSGESNLGLNMILAQDGNTVLLPNPSSNNSQGTVLAYKYFNNTWTPSKFVETSNAPNHLFGLGVAISSNANTLVIGAPGSNQNQGSAYVYRWNSTWNTPTQLFIQESNTSFGNPIAMSSDGNKIVIGAITSNQNQGSAFVYQWSGTNWVRQTQLIASDGRPQDNYGRFLTMSLDGNSIIVSAPNKYVFPNSNQGASYLYTWDTLQWVETKLVYTNASSNSLFGQNPLISGDGSTLLIGASNSIYIFNNTSNTSSNTTYYPTRFTSNVIVYNTIQLQPQGSNAMLGLRQYGITSNLVPYLYISSNDVQVAQLDTQGRLTLGSTPPYSLNYNPTYSIQTTQAIITPAVMTSTLTSLPGTSNIDLLNITNLLNINNTTAISSYTSNASFSNMSSTTAYIRNLFATNLDFDNVDVYNVLFENSLRSPTFVSTANYLNVAASNTILNFTNNGTYNGVQGFLRLYAPNPTIPSTGTNTPYLLGGTNARLLSATGTGHVSLRVNTTIPSSPILTYNYAVTEYGVSGDGGNTYDTTTGYVGMRVNTTTREMHLGLLSGTTNTLLLGYDTSRIYLGMTNNSVSTATSVIENGNLMIGATAQQTIAGLTPKLYCNGILYCGTSTKTGLYVSTDFTTPRVGINYIPTLSDTVFTVSGGSTFSGGQTTFNSNIVVNDLATFNNYIYSVRNIIVTSDSNIKTDLKRIDEPLVKVQQLSGYTYLRKDTLQRETGLIAQDVQQVLPEVIQALPNTNTLGIAYGNMMGLMVEAIKELTQKVEQLTNRVQYLEKELGI
jgi:hypothetical protein